MWCNYIFEYPVAEVGVAVVLFWDFGVGKETNCCWLCKNQSLMWPVYVLFKRKKGTVLINEIKSVQVRTQQARRDALTSVCLQQKWKCCYKVGLKADLDEKPHPALLPELIRSLHHRCHPGWPHTGTSSAPDGAAGDTPCLLSLLHSSCERGFCSSVRACVHVGHSHTSICASPLWLCTSASAYLVPRSPPALSGDKKIDLGTVLYIW